nr:stage II sporulation protein M [Lewinella sp. IMCC34183]
MRETEFIKRNKDKWERYEESLKRSDQDPDLLNQLYVHTTDDLSISRTFYPNRSVRVYLNGLAQRTFLQLYRGRRGEVRQFYTFWTDELPRVVHGARRYLFAALLTFVLAMLIGVVSYRIDPAFAETILGPDYVAMTEANIEAGDPMAVYKSRDRLDMSLHITLNNLLVALLTFVAGIFGGVGSVMMLVRNGVMLGVFQYFFYAQGDYGTLAVAPATEWGLRAVSWVLTAGGEGLQPVFAALLYVVSDTGVFRESLLTIWIHGALEISSIVIAGGAGLTLGSGLLFPGTYTRLQAFARSARAGVKIMLGTVPLFVLAGFLEGFVTRQTDLPESLRLVFILLCFGFIVWYYVIYPRVVVRRPAPFRAGRRPAPVTGPPEVLRIRSLGEQLTATFAVYRRGLPRILGGALLLTLAFCGLSFAFGPDPVYRYHFVAYIAGDVENVYELMTSYGRSRSLSYTALVALGFYGMLHLGLGAVLRHTDLVPTARSWEREGRLLAVSGLLALTFAFGGVTVAFVTFLTFPFLLMLGVGTYIWGLSVPVVFRKVYTNLGHSYGFLLVLVVIGLPLTFLLDSVLGGYLFEFLDWVIYTDGGTIDARNVMLQAFCYYFLFVLAFTAWVVGFALSLGSLLEIDTAGHLKEQIAAVGRRAQLRGLEREE